MRVSFVAVMALVVGSVGLCAEPPSVTVSRFSSAPRLDGLLEDACWKGAASIQLKHLVNGGESPSVATEALLGHDDAWLYVAARCHDGKGKRILANHRGRNNPWVFKDDNVEIFLDPPGRRGIYHFVLGAGNAKYDQEGRSLYGIWSAPWPSAARTADGLWGGELAIPLYLFGTTAVSSQPLSFNIIRNKNTDPPQCITWAPVGPGKERGVHDPGSFGTLSGMEGLPIRATFAPSVCDAQIVGPYQRKGERWSYPCRVIMGNFGGQAGKTLLIIEQKTVDGRTKRHSHAIDVPATGTETHVIDVPVEFPADRTVRAFLKGSEDEWCEVQGSQKESVAIVAGCRLRPSQLQRLSALVAYPDRSLYCGERTGRLTVGTAFTDRQFEDHGLLLEVEVRDERGRVVLQRSHSTTRNQGVTLAFPALEWTPGTYPVRARLLNRKRDVISQAASMIRVAAAPPAKVNVSKVDQERMCMLVNGEPFFPIGYLSQGGFGKACFWDEKAAAVYEADLMRRFKQAGCNIVVDWTMPGYKYSGQRRRRKTYGQWTEQDDQWLGKQLEAYEKGCSHAHEEGLCVLLASTGSVSCGVSYADRIRADHGVVLGKLPAVVERLRSHPGMIGWLGIDEPHWPIFNDMREQAELVRKVDPYHIQYSTSRGGGSARWYDAYDVYGRHAYWGPGDGRATPNRLASWVNGGYWSAKLRRRPIFATPQAQRLKYERELTPDERRCGIYLPVIQGAKGVMFFVYGDPVYRVMNPVVWRVISYTIEEIQILAPMLLEQRPPQRIEMKLVESLTPPRSRNCRTPEPPTTRRGRSIGGRAPRTCLWSKR